MGLASASLLKTKFVEYYSMALSYDGIRLKVLNLDVFRHIHLSKQEQVWRFREKKAFSFKINDHNCQIMFNAFHFG